MEEESSGTDTIIDDIYVTKSIHDSCLILIYDSIYYDNKLVLYKDSY